MIFSRANIGTFLVSATIQSCGLMTGMVTARLLGPSARGELATVLLWPVILSNLGLMGCNWALARDVANDVADESDRLCAAVALGLGAACVYYVLGYFLIPFVLPSDRTHLLSLARLCLLLIPLDIFNQMLLAVEQGRMRWRRYNFVRISFYLIYLSLICMIWYAGKAQVRWFVWAFLSSQFCTALLRLWIQRKLFVGCSLHLDVCRRLFRAGLPYFWATAGNLMTLQIDTILVVGFMDVQAAGMYAIASAFGNAQAALGDALGITSFAVASNEKYEGGHKLFLTETFRQSFLISSISGVIIACLIPLVIKPLFGTQFSQAIYPAVILALAASLTTSSGILNQGLRGAGRPYAGLVSQLIGTAIVALTASLFLRRFGIVGMAWAVALGASTQVMVLVSVAASGLQISPLRFWPFGAKDIRTFWRHAAAVRLRSLRSPA